MPSPKHHRLDAVQRRDERPYSAVSIEHVATTAGVTRGLAHYYFGGRKVVYTAKLRVAWVPFGRVRLVSAVMSPLRAVARRDSGHADGHGQGDKRSARDPGDRVPVVADDPLAALPGGARYVKQHAGTDARSIAAIRAVPARPRSRMSRAPSSRTTTQVVFVSRITRFPQV